MLADMSLALPVPTSYRTARNAVWWIQFLCIVGLPVYLFFLWSAYSNAKALEESITATQYMKDIANEGANRLNSVLWPLLASCSLVWVAMSCVRALLDMADLQRAQWAEMHQPPASPPATPTRPLPTNIQWSASKA
jgi:hypothetical protein